MAERGVPEYVPSATAAAIAGVPPERFRRQYIEGLLVEVLLARGQLLVDVASLEAAIGRPITCQMLCLAERDRDLRREYQRRYRRGEAGRHG